MATNQHGDLRAGSQEGPAAGAAGRRRMADMSGLLARGAIAGLFAGSAFILANMWYSVSNGQPSAAPFVGISSIFHGSDMAQPTAGNMVTGLVLHLVFSLAFGMAFALFVWLIPALRHGLLLPVSAVLYGLALYVLNFQILGRTAFPFFHSPEGPSQLLEALIHPFIFGLLLAPFLATRQPGR